MTISTFTVVSMLASHHFPHPKLLGESVRARKEMLLAEDGITYRHGRISEEHTVDVERREWVARPAPLSEDYASLGLQ